VVDLTAISSAQADDSPGITSIHEDDKKEPVSYWSQGDNPDLSVVSSIINPCERRSPIELSSSGQRDSMLTEIGSVLAWVEIYEHTLA
jgi:hypothetical protein